MTDDERLALYQRYYCNKSGQPQRNMPQFEELDDDDFERLAKLARWEDSGATPKIPGVNV